MHRRATIAASVGLHARPAALFAGRAAAQTSPVTIAKVVDGHAGTPVDGGSVLALMALGARHGEEVELTSDSSEALDELIALLEQDLDDVSATA